MKGKNIVPVSGLEQSPGGNIGELLSPLDVLIIMKNRVLGLEESIGNETETLALWVLAFVYGDNIGPLFRCQIPNPVLYHFSSQFLMDLKSKRTSPA
jgi:hypothetical protein